MGDVLADYLDSGGGVVLATFAFNTGYGIGGRVLSGGYLPLTTSSQDYYGWYMSLIPDQPAHPILAGVNSFNGGYSYHEGPITITSGAALVAHWSDGQPLVATKQLAGRMVGLNFFPPSSDMLSSLWVASTDGARLMANALFWAARLPDPAIVSQPQSVTNNVGATVKFTVKPFGTSPLTYQWLKDGVALTDGGIISGSSTASLTLSSVSSADQGGYSVIVSNALGSAASTVATLTVRFDPAVWSVRTSPISQNLCSVVYGISNYTAVGFSGKVLTSPDGVTWTSRTSGTSLGLYSVTYGNDKFVAVGDQSILSSVDGINWTTRDSGSYVLQAVACLNGGFMAVGDAGVMKVSSDGITWTTRSSGTTVNLLGVTCGNVTYVVTGYGGLIRTSPDGVTWTTRTSGTPNDLNGVTWNGALFVAQGNYGVILTSTNGVDWTSRASGTGNGLCTSAYGFDRFATVGDVGTILTSTNAVNWVANASGTTSLLVGDCAGPDSFVAVGYNGSIIQSVNFTTNGIWQQPTNQIVSSGQTARFNALTWWMTPPPTYQWRKNGIVLADGGNVVGAASPRLTLSNAQLSDSAGYSVVINSGSRWATSQVAMLTVTEAPTIVTQPASQFANCGQHVAFDVTADGTAPLNYQWRFNGLNVSDGGNISGALTPTLTLPSVQTTDAGSYSVVVTNLYGSVTSAVAVLTVNPAPPVILTDDDYFGFGANGFGFDISGVSGQTVVIEASTNFVNWSPLATNTLGTDLWYFCHADATNLPACFYRARLQ